MPRYRKIDSRIQNDYKFRSLSKDGKLVFLLVLVHPMMTSLGAMRATEVGLAEEFGYSVKEFQQPFGEVLSKGLLEYDKEACFLCAPNFLKYNQPENPNVVRGWANALDLLPECPLLLKVLDNARSLICKTIQKNGSFITAFDNSFSSVIETLTKEFGEPFPKGMAKQEQEQEQENIKENKKEKSPKKVKKSDIDAVKPDSVSQASWDAWMEIRKSKGVKKFSQYALELFQKNVEKAGLTLSQAIDKCISRNWAGFDSEWLEKDKHTTSNVPQRASTFVAPNFGSIGVGQAENIASTLVMKLHEHPEDIPSRIRQPGMNWSGLEKTITEVVLCNQMLYERDVVPLIKKYGIS